MNLIVPRDFEHFATDNKKVNFTIHPGISTIRAMEAILDGTVKAIGFVGRLVLFLLLATIFIPSFLVVTYLEKTWTSMLGDLFKL